MITAIVILSIVIIGLVLFISYQLKHYKSVFERISYELQGVDGLLMHDSYRLNNAWRIIQKEIKALSYMEDWLSG